jgi:hypothetical protein
MEVNRPQQTAGLQKENFEEIMGKWWAETSLRFGLDSQFRLEFTEAQARYAALVGVRDGIQDVVSKCHTWIGQQDDFKTNAFKTAMALSFLRICHEKLVAATNDIPEIELKLRILLAKVQPAAVAPIGGDSTSTQDLKSQEVEHVC